MKLWQLTSVIRNVEVMKIAAQSNQNWHEFVTWLENWATVVDTQDRAKLDYELPDLFVQTVLANSNLQCHLSEDGWLRFRKNSPDDQQITALQAFNRFGGRALEEAYEKGSAKVSVNDNDGT